MATIQLQTSSPWQKPGRQQHTTPHTKTLTPAIPQEPHNHVHHLRPTVSHASTPASTTTPTTYTAPTCLSAASYMHRHPTSTTKKTQTRSTVPPDPPLCMGVRQPAPTHLPGFACPARDTKTEAPTYQRCDATPVTPTSTTNGRRQSCRPLGPACAPIVALSAHIKHTECTAAQRLGRYSGD
jgi:hypothetical protein